MVTSGSTPLTFCTSIDSTLSIQSTGTDNETSYSSAAETSTQLSLCSVTSHRIYEATAPVVSLREEVGLWQAVCEPSEELLRLSSLPKSARSSSVALANAYTNQEWTYDQLRTQTNKLAASILHTLGPCNGRRIMLFMNSSPGTLLLLLAVSRLGALAVMCNSNYVGMELQHCINVSQPYAVICLSADAHAFRKLDVSARLISLLTEGEAADLDKAVELFADQGANYVDLLPPPKPASWHDGTLIVFSSGTSGMPKAVELSHRALISVFTLAVSASYFNLSVRETAFICMPTHHVGGICTWLINTVRGDYCVFVPAQRPANFERWTEAILKWRCNKLAANPTVLRALLAKGLANKIGAAKCVTAVSVGAGLLTPRLYAEATRAFDCPILQNWGMTEVAGGIVRVNAYLPSTQGSVGRLCGDVRARIVDERGQDIRGVGHLLVQSPTVMNGYVKDVKATIEAIDVDGWLHTGDLAYFNDRQELFVVDRLKDLIKYKGWSIAPAELEAILESHSDVAEAAVVGVDCNDGDGQKPRAFVVARPTEQSQSALEEQLFDLVKQNATNYKWLRGGMQFVDHLPRNSSNKVLKRELQRRCCQAG